MRCMDSVCYELSHHKFRCVEYERLVTSNHAVRKPVRDGYIIGRISHAIRHSLTITRSVNSNLPLKVGMYVDQRKK